MKRIVVALAVILLAGCAAQPRPLPYSGPIYTRASIANLTAVELASLFLAPEDAATIARAEERRPWPPGGPLSLIYFYARPRPLAEDICGRDVFYASFSMVGPPDADSIRRDTPVRLTDTSRFTQIAWDPGCATHPDRFFSSVGTRYANVGEPLTLADGMAILRSLARARAAAAGTGPLPFRLRCTTANSRDRNGPECPADPRDLLAAMPLHRAIAIDRGPFARNALCGPPDPESGDSVEIEISDRSSHVWEVRLRDMGTDSADITMSWQVARHIPRC